MKNIIVLHKIKGRIRDFQDLDLSFLKFVQWIKVLTQE